MGAAPSSNTLSLCIKVSFIVPIPLEQLLKHKDRLIGIRTQGFLVKPNAS